MAQYLKRYASLEQADNPVTVLPAETAKLPDPVENPKPIETPKESSPAELAAQSEIRKRLSEMEAASQQHTTPPPPAAPEPPPPRLADGDPIEDAIRDWPERAKGWVRNNPKLLTDPEQSARLNYAHHIAVRETGGENGTDRYYAAMESLLELSPSESQPQPQQRAPAPPRSAAASNVSAPPSRESPSMSGGKPRRIGGKVTLTPQQREAAYYSNVSEEEYARQLLIIEANRNE